MTDSTDVTTNATPFSREYFVEKILPVGEVHLLTGASSAGKTTWLFTFLREWQQGLPIFGQPSHPVPYVYVTCDQSKATITEMKQDFHLPNFPTLYVQENLDWINPNANWEGMKDTGYGLILSQVETKFPEARLIIIDASTVLTPEGKIIDQKTVARLLIHLGAWCTRKNKSILLMVHSAKMKADNKILQPRERVIGSGAWGAHTYTVIGVERTEPEKLGQKNSMRRVFVIPRRMTDCTYLYNFDENGEFVCLGVEGEEEVEENGSELAVVVGSRFQPGSMVTAKAMEEIAGDLEISRATVYREIKSMVKDGILLKTETKGLYQRPMVS